MSRADALVGHARWLEDVYREFYHFDPITAGTRIELAWCAVTRARDADRALVEHDTIPRITAVIDARPA